MKKLIYRKSDLMLVGTTQNNTDFNWEIEHNVIPNFAGTIEDYAEIQTEVDKPILIDNNGTIEVQERPKTNQELRQEILDELAQLDNVISRELEDKYIEEGTLPTYKVRADAMARKVELRNQLNTLQGG